MKHKINVNCKENPTQLLFRRSCKSVNTFSKTYSGASQLCTRSLVQQLQRKLPKTKYYENHGKIKRDLSIETDICIMRRYYRKKRNKFSNRMATSARSNYSTIYNETDTNDFTRDSSACGDSEVTACQKDTSYKFNLTSLVVDNLKKLLNDWITKYLCENNETKQKIDSVLDSILHKMDLQTNDTSSYTYTIDVELGHQRKEPESQSTFSKDLKLYPEKSEDAVTGIKSSYLTIPLCNKYLEIISTLSIPRKSHKNKKRKTLNKVKNFRYKKIMLSVSKSSKYLMTSSSLNFLTLRAKSVTKHCATYQRNDPEVNDPNSNFLPKTYTNTILGDNDKLTKSRSQNSTQNGTKLRNRSKEIPSIYENIYGINSGHIKTYETIQTGSNKRAMNLSEHQNVKHYKSTQENDKITSENEHSDQLVTIDFGNESNESKLDTENKNVEGENNLKINNKSLKNTIFKRKATNYQTIKSKRNKYFAKKSNNKIKRQKELLHNFQTLMKYFSKYNDKKDMQLQIKIKVCSKNKNEENTNTASQAHKMKSNINETNTPKENIKGKPALNSQNIISLLDGATSETKYLLRESTDILTGEAMPSNANSGSNTHIENLKIVQEINELRGIIKSLANTADKLISNHLYETNKIQNHSNHSKSKTEDLSQSIIVEHATENSLVNSALPKTSKGIQVSSNMRKSQLKSGLKLRKEPKKKECNSSSMKKKSSYNIIASESLIKVTDMTSGAQNKTNDDQKMIDNALTCSLPKSKSLYETSIAGNKGKLLALYCDDLTKSKNYTYSISDSIGPSHSNHERVCSYHTCGGPCDAEPKLTCNDIVSTNSNCVLLGDNNSCSSVCIEIDPHCFYGKKVIVRHREGMCFWEGCLYCTLLWLPVLLVSWLFYLNVIKDWMATSGSKITYIDNTQSQESTTTSSSTTSATNIHADAMYQGLSLSDLGF
ncbi:probable E3 ubiquitin-protein ligase bre1 isoform X1 [Danaus plexippus]|uniref:probable E3 ubiquitin-protein ligase bre1 isoform X1 n=1 Tax=Danaus plexippus TaxID=13037 RepID=UPI002AB31E8E|nr:probable E3 ubiquitin-protein ligase bre1 isoform X1 [Danaus plexippus]